MKILIVIALLSYLMNARKQFHHQSKILSHRVQNHLKQKQSHSQRQSSFKTIKQVMDWTSSMPRFQMKNSQQDDDNSKSLNNYQNTKQDQMVSHFDDTFRFMSIKAKKRNMKTQFKNDDSKNGNDVCRKLKGKCQFVTGYKVKDLQTMEQDISKGLSSPNYPCDSVQQNSNDLYFYSVSCADVAEEYSETISDDNLREFMESRPDNYYLDQCYTADPTKQKQIQIECRNKECPYGRVSRINYGIYGIQTGTCPDFQYNYQCHQDITIRVEKECKFKQICPVELNSELWDPADQIINKTTDPSVDKCKDAKEGLNPQLMMMVNLLITCECTKTGVYFPANTQIAPICV